MAISALVTGIVIGVIGKVPTYLVFKDALSKITNTMNEASNQSELTGSQIIILYNNNSLYPQNEALKVSDNYLNYQIPASINVTFNDNSPNIKQYVFFPDGSASGTDMHLSFKGHTATIKLSKLTGMPIINIDD